MTATCVKECSLSYHEAGLKAVRLRPNTKVPAEKWKRIVNQVNSGVMSFYEKDNLAIATGTPSGVVVVDCDSNQAAFDWLQLADTLTPCIVKTARGAHYYYRQPSFLVHNFRAACYCGVTYDIKGENGLVVAPPSVVAGHTYEWITPPLFLVHKELPFFKKEWMGRRKLAETIVPTTFPYPLQSVLNKIKRKFHAVSGHGGHNATYACARYLAWAGLSPKEAYVTLVKWNETNADPQWTRWELEHKIREAYK